jgi:hypothetical protein
MRANGSIMIGVPVVVGTVVVQQLWYTTWVGTKVVAGVHTTTTCPVSVPVYQIPIENMPRDKD